MSSELSGSPAIVRPATDAQAELRAAFAAFEESGRKRLEAAIRIGGILTERKKACGHGNWLKWLEAHFPFGRKRAPDFMRVFREQDKCRRAATFEEALGLLSGCGDEAEEPEPSAPSAANVATRPHLGPVPSESPEEPARDESEGDADDAPESAAADESGEPDAALFDSGDESDEGEPDAPESAPAAPEPPPAPPPASGVPSWMKPGNNVDPENDYYDLLTAFSALSAKVTKAINSEGGDKLLHALTLHSNTVRKTHMVLYTSEVIEGDELKGGQVKFVGLRPLRALIRRAGARKTKLSQADVDKTFDEANDPEAEDGKEAA